MSDSAGVRQDSSSFVMQTACSFTAQSDGQVLVLSAAPSGEHLDIALDEVFLFAFTATISSFHDLTEDKGLAGRF